MTVAITPDVSSRQLLEDIERRFSDESLRQDPFLHGRISENEAGWLQIDVLQGLLRPRWGDIAKDLLMDSIRCSADLEIYEQEEDKMFWHQKQVQLEHHERQHGLIAWDHTRRVYIRRKSPLPCLDPPPAPKCAEP